MKKTFFCIALFGIVMITICGCSNSNKESNEKKYENYRDAVKALDFEAARDTMFTYRERYLEVLLKHWYKYKDERKEAEGKFYRAFDYIYKAEVQYILSELKGDECTDKITFLLEEIPVEGEKFPEGLCDRSVARRGNFGHEGLPLDAYIIWTQHYNSLCNNILSLAINRKNQDIAKYILLQFVDNVEVTVGEKGCIVDGISVDGSHGYIKYTSADRDAAKKEYDEAVRNGAFQ